MAKRNEEPVEEPKPTGEILEAVADIFYLSAEGMESHVQIRGTTAAIVLAESTTAIQSIVENGGTARPGKGNGTPSKNGKAAESTLPYYTDKEGVKRCNKTTEDGERCGQPVSQREGKYGMFWSCKNYKNHAA